MNLTFIIKSIIDGSKLFLKKERTELQMENITVSSWSPVRRKWGIDMFVFFFGKNLRGPFTKRPQTNKTLVSETRSNAKSRVKSKSRIKRRNRINIRYMTKRRNWIEHRRRIKIILGVFRKKNCVKYYGVKK